MKKRERLDLIKKIVNENDIETQNELVQLLEAEGLLATQATISRDINEIGIIKIPTAGGRYIYGLPKEKRHIPQSSPSQPVGKSIKKLGLLEKCLHIDVVPGTSRLLKRLLFENYADQIFSLISDDDSLFLMAQTEAAAQKIHQEVSAWMRER